MFTLEDKNSILWDEFTGPTGNESGNIDAFLSLASYEEKIDEVGELMVHFTHQLTFYGVHFVGIPYMVKELMESDHVLYQTLLITELGVCQAVEDIEHYKDIDREILTNYNNAILDMREFTKQFLIEKADEISKLDENVKQDLITGLLGMFGEKEQALADIEYGYTACYVGCLECDDCNEDMEDMLEEEPEYIEPAELILGEWDEKDFSDIKVWLPNYLKKISLDSRVKLLSYFWGEYTCPECGTRIPVSEARNNYN